MVVFEWLGDRILVKLENACVGEIVDGHFRPVYHHPGPSKGLSTMDMLDIAMRMQQETEKQ